MERTEDSASVIDVDKKTDDHFWLYDISRINTIATLGPSGTSSEAAAEYLSKKLMNRSVSVKLFDSFEKSCDYSASRDDCIFLVANAYSSINAFYMNPQVKLIGSFYYSPPPYFVCCLDDYALMNKIQAGNSIKVITHPAPVMLISSLLDAFPNSDCAFQENKVEFLYAKSTSSAAIAVSKGHYDACLVNERASKLYNLKIVSPPAHFDMVWSVFC